MFANAGWNLMSSISRKLSRFCGGIGDDVSAAHKIHPQSRIFC